MAYNLASKDVVTACPASLLAKQLNENTKHNCCFKNTQVGRNESERWIEAINSIR